MKIGLINLQRLNLLTGFQGLSHQNDYGASINSIFGAQISLCMTWKVKQTFVPYKRVYFKLQSLYLQNFNYLSKFTYINSQIFLITNIDITWCNI